MAAPLWYCGSKKYAEIAAYETQKRTSAKYTLASINPPSEYDSHVSVMSRNQKKCGSDSAADGPVILGPSIHYADAEGIDKADPSTAWLFASLAAGKSAKVPDTAFTGWADVSLVPSSHLVPTDPSRFCKTDLAGPKCRIRLVHGQC